jgi:hypothetical protein
MVLSDFERSQTLTAHEMARCTHEDREVCGSKVGVEVTSRRRRCDDWRSIKASVHVIDDDSRSTKASVHVIDDD